MAKAVHREVINGRMTVSQVRREKGEEYTVKADQENLWGKVIGEKEVKKRRKGYDYVSVLVYEGKEESGEPVGDWMMPIQLRYDLKLAAQTAEAQTKRTES